MQDPVLHLPGGDNLLLDLHNSFFAFFGEIALQIKILSNLKARELLVKLLGNQTHPFGPLVYSAT